MCGCKSTQEHILCQTKQLKEHLRKSNKEEIRIVNENICESVAKVYGFGLEMHRNSTRDDIDRERFLNNSENNNDTNDIIPKALRLVGSKCHEILCTISKTMFKQMDLSSLVLFFGGKQVRYGKYFNSDL